jgi:hypothetical protein
MIERTTLAIIIELIVRIIIPIRKANGKQIKKRTLSAGKTCQ